MANHSPEWCGASVHPTDHAPILLRLLAEGAMQ